MKPTEQQLQAVEAFRLNPLLKIKAFAGAAKTTTLQLLSAAEKERGLYLAFNKEIQLHASKRFDPARVECRTVNSLAFRAIKAKKGYSGDKMMGKLSSAALARELKLPDYKISSTHTLSPIQHAHLLARTVTRFCHSADEAITPDHVPHYKRLDGLPPSLVNPIKEYAAENAQALWERMISANDPIPLGHDGYLKLWSIEKPQLDYGYILLDEAQDTNPSVLSVLAAQTGRLALAGDEHQQLYEFRQAVNAMQSVRGAAKAHLTQSFRFGPELAAEATKVLRTLGEIRTLRGTPEIETRIIHEQGAQADCILARTNACVVTEVIAALQAGQKPHVLGGVTEVKRLLSDVSYLKQGRAALSSDLFGFDNWDQVKEFAGTEEGEDLAAFVNIVSQHGEDALTEALSKTATNPAAASLTIGTAHKSKGCEWNRVRLADDLLTQRVIKRTKSANADIRLFYVAMTRAKSSLSLNPEILATFTREMVHQQDPAPAQTSSRSTPAYLRRLFNQTAPTPGAGGPLPSDQTRDPSE